MDQNELKRQVAQRTVQVVFGGSESNILLGVGTGSTVDLFIEQLDPFKDRIEVAVSSSIRSSKLLQALNIDVVDANRVSGVAVYVDGADEVDSSFALTKGGGGAHTQEKIVASIADEFICIVDESKVVKKLGGFPIPVEVIQPALASVEREIKGIGGKATLREGFTTDNGHAILDVHNLRVDDPDQLETTINNLPGVVEVGIFARHRPERVLVGGGDGVYELEK